MKCFQYDARKFFLFGMRFFFIGLIGHSNMFISFFNFVESRPHLVHFLYFVNYIIYFRLRANLKSFRFKLKFKSQYINFSIKLNYRQSFLNLKRLYYLSYSRINLIFKSANSFCLAMRHLIDQVSAINNAELINETLHMRPSILIFK